MKSIFLQTCYGLMLISALSFNSCTKKTPLEQVFSDAEKVKVYIYAGSTVPQVHYETNDIDKMKAFATYVDDSTDAKGTCNYEGRLIAYFNETDSNVMKFSLANGCTQITYTVDGKTYTKALSKTGVDYMENLKKIQ